MCFGRILYYSDIQTYQKQKNEIRLKNRCCISA
jgi:hypothetical protein